MVAGVVSGALVVGAAAYALTFGALGQAGADDGAGTLAPVLAVTTVTAPTSATQPAPPPPAPSPQHHRRDGGRDLDHDDD